ncbi:MAG: D-lyxose/D-mannose family sugar isomerase [Bacteroidota bacterium]|nr:D-lyxose/D-mannose family sugar isomerase [Bacteroidota bacterium]
MKRSEINKVYLEAKKCFETHGWILPPNPKWDVTDFGLGDFNKYGLVLINLCEESEYCEKLMYARKGMTTPAHYHKKKKEDIICRNGAFEIQLWDAKMSQSGSKVKVKINNEWKEFDTNTKVKIQAGERITLFQGVNHAFWPITDQCIIGEVSTANDDLNDNFFDNPDIGRYPHVEEDESPLVKLLSDKN